MFHPTTAMKKVGAVQVSFEYRSQNYSSFSDKHGDEHYYFEVGLIGIAMGIKWWSAKTQAFALAQSSN